MNKNILAIAIATVVAAPAVFADATVYGNVNVSENAVSGVASKTAGADSKRTTTSSGLASNSSYLGVKGSEDVGAGMKAVYQMEFGVSMTGNGNDGKDAHTGINDTRNTFVGVGGGFGTVLAGRHDSLIKLSGRKYDLFGDQIGNNRNILGGSVSSAQSQIVDGRHDNVLAYVSPTWSGFHFGVAYVGGNAVSQAGQGQTFGSDSSTGAHANNAPAVTAIADYDIGNFSVTAGYINISHGADAAAAAGIGAGTGDITAYRLGGAYKFGQAKIVALYQNDNILKQVTTTGNARDTYGLGGSYQVSNAGTIKAQYYMAGNTVKNSTSATKNSGTLTTVGYDHALSKNTTAFAVYALANNDGVGAYSVDMAGSGSGGNVSAVAGKDNSAFSVGIQHKF